MVAVPLQPLRIPCGWQVVWNTLFELDPTTENVQAGYFGGSSLFTATHEHLRLSVDVEWRPENTVGGAYHLRVEYVPWQRTPSGRRRKGTPLDFRDAQVVHEYQTRCRVELVAELESTLRGRSEWLEHS